MIEHVADDGTHTNITEAVAVAYDTLLNTLDFGSGMLDTEEVDALRVLARVTGWDLPKYGLDTCQRCGHSRGMHYAAGRACCMSVAVGMGIPWDPDRWVVDSMDKGTDRCPCNTFKEEGEGNED